MVSNNKDDADGLYISLGKIISADGVFVSTDQTILMIGIDKLEIYLIKRESNRKSLCSPLLPLGISITVLVALLSSDFHEFLSLSPAVWEAVFVLTLISSIAWLVSSSVKAIQRWRRGESIDDFLARIKRESKMLSKSEMTQYETPKT